LRLKFGRKTRRIISKTHHLPTVAGFGRGGVVDEAVHYGVPARFEVMRK
jgi:hypothetical protein